MTGRQLSLLTAAVAVIVTSVACGGSAPASPTALPTARGSTPVTPAPSPAPLPSATVEVIRPTNWPLSGTGPWLVYLSERGLIIANLDGTGQTLLHDAEGLGPAYLYNFAEIASPSGGWVALTTFDDPDTQAGPSLQLVHVPDGLAAWSTPLLSADIQTAIRKGAGPGSAAGEAAEAVTMARARAWSPDGQRLAFVAALDGPSSDLYVYDVSKTTARRVTSGPNQMASLSWSPDGQWIAHQAVESFGSGAGWSMGAVWTVTPDGRRLNKLYAPRSGGEIFVGWSRGDSLISYSFAPDGSRDVRAAGADGAVENILIPSYVSDVAYDPATGTIAYAVSQDMTFAGAESGAFLWNPVGSGSNRVDPGDWSGVQWSAAAGRFYFEGSSGVMGVTPAGETVAVPVVDLASVSPDGRHVALWGNGYGDRQSGIHIYTSDLEFVATLEEFDAPVVSWRPDSAGLMAIGEAGLTYYPLEGQPLLVDASATASFDGGLGWVSP